MVIDNASIKSDDSVCICQRLVNRRGASRHFSLHIDPKNRIEYIGLLAARVLPCDLHHTD